MTIVRTLAVSEPDFAADASPLTLVGQFERVATRNADRLAVGTDKGDRTYAELNSAANRLARHIDGLGAKRRDRIAILLRPGPDIYVAMLAVLKTAGIVVFLDPADPPDRLNRMVADTEPALILTDTDHHSIAVEIAGRAGTTVVGQAAGEADDNLGIDIDPDDTAFLVFTSGSTGRPKAVMKSHGHVLLQPLTAAREMEVTADDRILMLAPLSGGQGINTAWVALANGASLIAFPTAEKGMSGLPETIEARSITVLISPPSLFRTFMRTLSPATRFPGVRVITLAGDAATARDHAWFRHHFPNGMLILAFAASEAGYIALNRLPRDVDVGTGPLPVGRACAQRSVRIIDLAGNTCPSGVIGSVEVGGPHLAGGYWRDPDLTSVVFPLGPEGARVFRSSDLGSMAADGSLVLAGRADNVVKIRGHRVDLGEVEAALSNLPGVAAAAAAAIAIPNREPYLVGYLVLDRGTSASERRIRTLARAAIPRHLIPSSFVLVDSLPRTANGKVDRNQLSAKAPSHVRPPTEAPATETERLLIPIWERAFGLDGIAPSDDFFDLGGDSLIAVEIAAAVHGAIGVSVADALFDAPSPRALAAEVDRRKSEQSPVEDLGPLPMARDRPIPLSFEQLAMWRQSQDVRGSLLHNVTTAMRLNGPLDVGALHHALNHVVARYEALHTRFERGHEEPTQVVEAPQPVILAQTDLSDAGDHEMALRRIVQREQARPFDLCAAPPLRFALIRTRGGAAHSC